MATSEQIARDLPDLDMCDDTELDTARLTDMAFEAEDCARAVNGITNSEGGSASQSQSEVYIAGTHGFSAGYRRSSFGFSTVVLAEKDGAMQRDYDYSAAVFAEDLKSPKDIGLSAARRTLARLGAQKAKTGSFPVVYDNRVSRSLAGHMASAINGAAIARGTSFLKDSMGELIANPAITLIDDPYAQEGQAHALLMATRYLFQNVI